MAVPDFPRQIVETIAKRAGNYCSNPDCDILTCGPAETDGGSVMIGEAAHIYGARQDSARYRLAMTDQERGDITNAIWLCRNCHKQVDADPVQFSVDVLFEWRSTHDAKIAARMGKPSDAIWQKIVARQLEEFQTCSYLAQRIVIDKPDMWEHKLTIELFRSCINPVVMRWNDLKRGLYVRPAQIISAERIDDWIQARIDSILLLIEAFSQLSTNELPATWGPPGQPGNASEILRVCNLLADCAGQVLHWEEAVRFAALPNEFREIQKLLSGAAGMVLEQIARISAEIKKIIQQETLVGTYNIALILQLPPNWSNDFSAAMKRAKRNYARR